MPSMTCAGVYGHEANPYVVCHWLNAPMAYVPALHEHQEEAGGYNDGGLAALRCIHVAGLGHANSAKENALSLWGLPGVHIFTAHDDYMISQM